MGSEELILRLETIFPAYNINSVMIREVPAVEPSNRPSNTIWKQRSREFLLCFYLQLFLFFS